MARGQISLNSVGYIIESFDWNRQGFALVHREISQPFAPQFRTEGVQQQADLRGASTKVFGDFSHGFGRSRVPSDKANDPNEYKRFWDSTMETRWGDGARQSILPEQSVETVLERIRGAIDFKGTLGGIWEDDTGTDLVWALYTQTDDTWDQTPISIVAAAVNAVGLDVIEYKGSIIVLAAIGTDDHIAYVSTDDGASFAAVATTVLPTGLLTSVGLHEDMRGGMLAINGLGELVYCLWNEDGGSIDFYSSTSAAGVVTGAPDLEISIASGNGPLGLVSFTGEDNTDKLYLLTVEGLHEIDVSGAWTSTLVRSLNSSNSTGGALAVGDDGFLWMAQGVSNDAPARCFRMDPGTRRITEVPNDLGIHDGVPTDMLGPIRRLVPSGGLMYAAGGGGAASRNGWVLCHNGFGWHYMFQDATANRLLDFLHISAFDDGEERLHFGIRTAAATSDTQYLAFPNTNPEALTGSIKRTQTTVLDLPFFDGGMPTTPGVILQTQMSATRLTSTGNEFVNVDYAVDGGTRGSTDLGNFDSGLFNKDWPKGATAGTGVSARNVALRLNMFRDSGTPTNDPVIHSVTQAYLKQPSVNQRYIVKVDIQASADVDDSTPEAVITTLEAARDLSTLPAFEYGDSGVKHVKVRSIFWQEEIDGDEQTAPDTLAQRVGGAVLVLEEVV